MEVRDTLDDLPESWRRCVIALGMFDGLHLGHQQVIRQTVCYASKRQVWPLVLTFRNHPLSVLTPEMAPLYIEDMKGRHAVMEQMGVKGLLELPFSEALAQMTADDFLADLVAKAAPVCLVVGENYSFGDGGQGSPSYLKRLEDRFGYETKICPLLELDGELVSSTRVRDLLQQGDLPEVNRLLGRFFMISGIVGHGDARGRDLGFPTANLPLDPQRAMLPNGAYAVQVRFAGTDRFGIASIGNHPTFGGKERRLEIHLLDFAGSLYGENLQVRFVARLREERCFPSALALQRQLCKDEAEARKIFRLQ